jgi:starch synthase
MKKHALRILHAASEMAPFIKTGGLADVVSALPVALAKQGHDVRVVIPGFRQALATAAKHGLTWLPDALTIEAGGVDHYVGVGVVEWRGVKVYLLACNELYDRPGVYGPSPSQDYDDNARRFSVFCKAALALPGMLAWKPHIIHAHDWQAALIPALRMRGFHRTLPGTRTVFSIHNIAYQGAFWHFDLKLTGLDWSLFNPTQLEHYGRLNFLKAGIVFADHVTTVSRRYAEEIQTPEGGFGLDGVLREHNYKLTGIVNGVDTDEWNPATDAHLGAHYDAKKLAGKRQCRDLLRQECGLAPSDRAAVVGVVSRLVDQKGIDLVLAAVEPYILAGRMQLVVLGSGDHTLEHRLHHLQAKHPGWVYAWFGYNEGLAHRIIAGSDLFLMPSRTEPCGLTQLYSLRYGTLPLVRYTGGLADTVRDVATGDGTGFTFGPMDLGHFSSVLDRALGLFEHYPEEWKNAQVRSMAQDVSWDHVGTDYQTLYRELVAAD